MILLHALRARSFKQLRDIVLDFPDDGSVLIEGRNEAGKSTLFEAAFFALYGKPLDPAATQEELKTYHADEMSVELEFSVDGRRMTVRRTLKANQSCALDWIDVDGAAKSLKGANAVNQRIREEIGVSASTLLNTCFVEQKNLERLESLDKNQRRDAINELLNLRILTQLESEFRITTEDRREVERLKTRVEVAALDDAYPRLRKAEQVAVACERFARLSELIRQRSEWETESSRLAVERQPLGMDRTAVNSSLATARGVAARLELLRTSLTLRVQQWGRELRQADLAAEKLERTRSLAGELPATKERLDAVELVAERARQRQEDAREEGRISDALHEAAQALAQARTYASDWSERVASLRESLPDLEESCRVADTQARDADRIVGEAELREALGAWAEAVDRCGESPAIAGGAELDGRSKAAERRREAAQLDADRAVKTIRTGWVVAGAGALAAGAGFAFPGLLFLVLTLGFILAAAGIATALRSTAAARALFEEARAARSEIDGIEGERRAFAAQAAQSESDRALWKERSESCVRRIVELGAAIPVSAAAARERWQELPAILREDARSAAEGAHAVRRAEQSKLEAIRSRLESEIGSPVEISLEMQARAESLSGQLARLQQAMDTGEDDREALTGLGIDLDGVEAALNLLRNSVAERQQAERDLPALEREAAQHADSARSLLDDAAAAWSTAQMDSEMPPAPDAVLELVSAEGSALASWLNHADLAGLESRIADLDRRIRAIDMASGTLADRIADANRSAVAYAVEFGWDSLAGAEVSHPWIEGVRGSREDLAEADSRSAAQWLEAHRDAYAIARSNRDNRVARAEAAGIVEEALDLADEKAEYSAMRREIAIKRRAGEIVQGTRTSIVCRVMPLTVQNMRRMLPLLTDGRYHDAEWNDEANALTVFDNEARRHVRKRVFSGGARDQISLSLRLAFALATLPGEYSTRPGWLFLDEPLSSFDKERTQRLVDLLTRGLVRKEFSQILLVSHSDSFDPAQFDHRLRMEGGRIVTGDGRERLEEPVPA